MLETWQLLNRYFESDTDWINDWIKSRSNRDLDVGLQTIIDDDRCVNRWPKLNCKQKLRTLDIVCAGIRKGLINGSEIC